METRKERPPCRAPARGAAQHLSPVKLATVQKEGSAILVLGGPTAGPMSSCEDHLLRRSSTPLSPRPSAMEEAVYGFAADGSPNEFPEEDVVRLLDEGMCMSFPHVPQCIFAKLLPGTCIYSYMHVCTLITNTS